MVIVLDDFVFEAEPDTLDLFLNSPAFLGSDTMFQDEDYYGKTIWDGEKFVSPDQWALNMAT